GGRVVDWVFPTSVFASAQLGFSNVDGASGGVAIGVAWKLIGDTHLLLGYNSVRLGSLRDDLRRQWDQQPSGRLDLAPGEDATSIRGSEVANGLVLMLGVPMSLKSVFGGS